MRVCKDAEMNFLPPTSEGMNNIAPKEIGMDYNDGEALKNLFGKIGGFGRQANPT